MPPSGKTAPTPESQAAAVFSEPQAMLDFSPRVIVAGFDERMQEGRDLSFGRSGTGTRAGRSSSEEIMMGAPATATLEIPESTSLSNIGNTVVMPANTTTTAATKVRTLNIVQWYTRLGAQSGRLWIHAGTGSKKRVYLCVNGPQDKDNLPQYSAWVEFG